jgi:hypothetical protein
MASRGVELGEITNNGQFQTSMCQYATMVKNCTSSTTVTAMAGTTFGGQSGGYGAAGSAVTITVKYPMPYVVPGLSNLLGGSGPNLVSVNSFLAEPY